ncbi:MAG TPA: rhodanese-like domain-containing protein [Prolixibacteraceae bacterium]|jgi:rhodanese-related sulfurtransferase
MKTTEQPTLQAFHMKGIKHINPSDALEALTNGEAVMIDVRELNEVKLESFPLDRVLNHPMSVIAERLPYIAKDQNIIVACHSGVRSVKVANLLIQHGYQSVASLDGGLLAWKAKGLPLTNQSSPAGCACKSSPSKNIDELSLSSAPRKNSPVNLDFKSVRRI